MKLFSMELELALVFNAEKPASISVKNTKINSYFGFLYNL